MNERHGEMMNEINAGAGWPVTASGQPEAARSCHGGVGRGITGQSMGRQMVRVLSLLAVIVGFWSGVALAATVTLYPTTNTPTGTVTNPTNAYANDSVSADVLSNNSTLTVTGFNNTNLGVISDVTAYVKYKTSAAPGNDTYAFDAAVNGSTFNTPIIAANTTNRAVYVTTAGTSFGALTWAQVGTLAIKNTTAKSGPSDGYLVNWDVAYIVVNYTLDSTAPTVSSVAVQTGLTVDVTFSEAMGTGVTTASNYTVSGAGKGTLANNPNSVALVSGNTYRLTWSTGEMLNGGNITITVANAQDAAGNTIGSPNSGTHTGGAIGVPPTVTINQAGAQADPTGTSPINFTVVFSESVANFATGDVTITGTAGGTKTATVTGSGTTYNVAATGMTTAGTVIASINAGVATDGAGNGNTASTSTDNSVSWTTGAVCTRIAPTLSINTTAQNVKTNATAVYTISVTNNDTAACAGTSTFTIGIGSETESNAGTFVLPSTLSATSVTLAAGATSASLTLTVTSDTDALDGYALQTPLTVTDATNHNLLGVNTSVTTTVANFDPMIHSSLSTSSTKWGGNWGTAAVGSKYGEFTCATCHTRSTTNIKRVKTSLTSGTTDKFPIEAASGTIQFLTAVDGSSHFGDDLPPTGRATSNRICEGCHSQNNYHNYNTANNATYGGNLLHENNKDCVTCHQHNKGFGASCTTCHPTYPEPPATNAHATHAGSAGYAFICTVCHPQDHDGTATDITFTGVAATWAGATYTSADKTCSSLYCHGSAPADWDAGTGGACGDCHGDANGRPNGANEPSGGSHLTTSHQVACTNCHSHDGTDKNEHVNGPAGANGDALVSSAGTSIGGYTYGGSQLASSPDPDGYKYTGGACSTVTCHDNATWGGTGGCTFCHGGTDGSGNPQYWPDGTGSSYADSNAGAHDNHVLALAEHLYSITTLDNLRADATTDAKQKAICAFCHPSPGGSGHATDSGDQRVDLNAAGSFLTYNGAGASKTDTTSGAYSLANLNCSNLACHNQVATPSGANNWNTPTAPNCTTLCHPTGSYTNRHDTHVTTEGYACTQCHTNQGTSYRHADGQVQLVWNNAGSFENTYGGAAVTYSQTAPLPYKDATWGTCAAAACHNNKTTPAWSAATTGVCTLCHTLGGTNTATNAHPASGIHDVARITGTLHDDSFTYNNGGSTANCVTCHTATPTTGSGHINGTNDYSHGAADATDPKVNFAATVGFADAVVPTCAPSLATGCHIEQWAAATDHTWTRQWHESAGANTGAECRGCHGTFTQTWRTGVNPVHTTNFDGQADGAEVRLNHDHGAATETEYNQCISCHVYNDATYGTLGWNPTAASKHGNGIIEMITAMGYATASNTCANTCHGTEVGSHAMTPDSGWTVANLAGPALSCTGCHTGSGTGGLKVGPSSPHTTLTKGGAAGSAACSVCHPEHSGGVLVANNATVGISYTAGSRTGFRLGGTGTTGTTEPDICWNCHDLTANGSLADAGDVSEWGTNTGGTYNYGSYNKKSWFDATGTWSSATFSYKNGSLTAKPATRHARVSTHDVASTVGTTRESISYVVCSYCHDVHNLNLATGDNQTGKPFLRGSWRPSGYKEDGAPKTGVTFAQTDNFFGAVPRGGTLTTGNGGYQIDQNNANPNVTYTYATNDGLCNLCHTQASIQTAWVGHNNSVRGFANDTTAARNIFGASKRGLVGGSQNNRTVRPYMAYQGVTQYQNSDWMGGLRSNDLADGSDPSLAAPRMGGANDRYAYDAVNFQWGTQGTGLTNLDITGTSVNADYHSFSCSKCHTPHASRLPRLMITNCLDTRLNTWDDQYASDANWASWTLDMTGGKQLAYTTSAQNCHRRIDANGDGDTADTGEEPGWNTATPW